MAEGAKDTEVQGGGDVAIKRTSPIQFFKEVRRETAKVTWPTWKETWLTTVMVFIMVGFLMVFFFVVDLGLGYGVGRILGIR